MRFDVLDIDSHALNFNLSFPQLKVLFSSSPFLSAMPSSLRREVNWPVGAGGRWNTGGSVSE